MPRVKLYEHSAKTAMSKALGIPYRGIKIDKNTDFKKLTAALPKNKKYVVKVDQGVKKRMKNGLVILNVNTSEIPEAIKKIEIASPSARNDKTGSITTRPHPKPPLKMRGSIYSNFLVEEFIAHKPTEETYFSLERERGGVIASVSKLGGIDIEENPESIKQFLLTSKNYEAIAKIIGVNTSTLEKIKEFFDKNYFCFLEINPLVVKNSKPCFLDLAATVDSAGEFFSAQAWSSSDVVPANRNTPEEKAIVNLKANSQAALSLSVVNPNGSIFLLMSGGGASIVLADEVYNLGAASNLVNYGEYSGNPNAEETYAYTREVISLMKKSTAKKKTLIIGGGVANFTDVRVTFNGIIRALEEEKTALQKMKTKIFVRRGGPGQTEGLASMRKFLTTNNFDSGVYGPELPLQKIVELAIG